MFFIIVIITIVINFVMIIYIIAILFYAPSVFTCIVGGAIQMTVYITFRQCCNTALGNAVIQHLREKWNFRVSPFYQVLPKHKLFDLMWHNRVSFDCLPSQ